MNAFRVSRPLHLLALLALIGQLLLPMSHAASMAARGADPLMLAFCGSATPQSVQRLRDSAPPELKAALAAAADAAAQRDASPASCPLCAGLAGVSLALLPVASAGLSLPAQHTVPAPLQVQPVTTAQLARPPPQRGPPIYS